MTIDKTFRAVSKSMIPVAAGLLSGIAIAVIAQTRRSQDSAPVSQ